MRRAITKNILLSAGAYYLSMWVAPLLSVTFDWFTDGIIYTSDFQGTVVMPLVSALPVAPVAAVAGGVTAWLVESRNPWPWAVLPAALYAAFGFLGHYWAGPPGLLDRVAQVIGAGFPALACIVGGKIAAGRRGRMSSAS